MTNLVDIYRQCRRLLPPELDIFASQEGEDILIRRLLKGLYTKPGFFVDVGAHHPTRFSTTLHYYLRGWRGINIEPNRDVIGLFESLRPGDINICTAVGEQDGCLPYYRFLEPAFNTLSEAQAEYAKTKTALVGLEIIEITPLKSLLAQYMPIGEIDRYQFMNIDVEGFELPVLRSNDWQRYRPRLLLVEALNSEAEREISTYLQAQRYLLVARTKNTFFYAEAGFKAEYVD
jgi:FkbM family methyltransferase